MKQPKDKYEHVTKTSRIEWAVTRNERGDAKAIFYVVDPLYHGHPWTPCVAHTAPELSEVVSYAYTELEPAQAEALIKALQIATKWTQGKKIAGAKKISGERPSAEELTAPRSGRN